MVMGNKNQIDHRIGEHATTYQQIVDKHSTKAQHRAMQAVGDYIDTVKKIGETKWNTKIMLLIQQELVRGDSDGGRKNINDLKCDKPIFSIVASSKKDMKVLAKTYNKVYHGTELTRIYKVMPYIGRLYEEEGKDTKVTPLLDKYIGYSYDGRDRPQTTPRRYIDIIRDEHPDAESYCDENADE